VNETYRGPKHINGVDEDMVPVPHFGICLDVKSVPRAGRPTQVERYRLHHRAALRREGKPGAQWTMFLEDPSGNALEFKAMVKPENLFAKYYVDE